MKCSLYTIDEFIEELCEFNHEIINEYIRFADLDLFLYQKELYWNGINNELQGKYVKEEYEVEIYKNWNKVKIIFNDDIDRLKEIHSYNGKILNEFISKLKKIGKVKIDEKEIHLKVNYLKASIYMKKNIYVYIDNEYSTSNKKEIDKLISGGIDRKKILVDSNEYNSVIPLLINNVKYNDLIFIPSILILKDINVLCEVLKVLNKGVDIIIGEYVGISEEFKYNWENFLNEISNIFNLNGVDDYLKAYSQCNNLENKNQIVKQEVIESDELEGDKKICNEIPSIRKFMKNIKSE